MITQQWNCVICHKCSLQTYELRGGLKKVPKFGLLPDKTGKSRIIWEWKLFFLKSVAKVLKWQFEMNMYNKTAALGCMKMLKCCMHPWKIVGDRLLWKHNQNQMLQYPRLPTPLVWSNWKVSKRFDFDFDDIPDRS